MDARKCNSDTNAAWWARQARDGCLPGGPITSTPWLWTVRGVGSRPYTWHGGEKKRCHGTCKHASNVHRCGTSTWRRMNTNFTTERIPLHNAAAFDSLLGRRRRSHGLLFFQLLSLHLLSGDDFARCERPAMGGGAHSGPKGARLCHQPLPCRPRSLDFPIAHETHECYECQHSCTYCFDVFVESGSHKECNTAGQHQPHRQRTNQRQRSSCVRESQVSHHCCIGGGAAHQQNQFEHGCKRECPCRRLQTGWQANGSRTPPPRVGTHLRRFVCAAPALAACSHTSQVRPARRSSHACWPWTSRMLPRRRSHRVGAKCTSSPTEQDSGKQRQDMSNSRVVKSPFPCAPLDG
mmetsp:Transcript_4373/g.27845  ORF Transcript_4373/g.27845 Transcript_4373/m.27845 type:complete len:350 (-) Transcript_4373:1024-2073(-)